MSRNRIRSIVRAAWCANFSLMEQHLSRMRRHRRLAAPLGEAFASFAAHASFSSGAWPPHQQRRHSGAECVPPSERETSANMLR
jgi:hypothetical protein